MKQKSSRKIIMVLSALATTVAAFATIASVPWTFYQPKAPKSLIKVD